MKMTPPNRDEYPEYYHRYISLVNTVEPLQALEENEKKLLKFLSKMEKKQLLFRYAPGKWSIKEIINHITDGERIFCYRALRFARNDRTSLPGFEENDYVPHARADQRKLKSLVREFKSVRKATIELFRTMNEEMLSRSGVANENEISVKAILYIIIGHQLHHVQVIQERYLDAFDAQRKMNKQESKAMSEMKKQQKKKRPVAEDSVIAP